MVMMTRYFVDMFKLWMNSIHWYCRFEDQHDKPEDIHTDGNNKYDPPVILIGTHTDEVNYSEKEMVCKKCIMLIKKVPHIRHSRSETQ